MKKHGVLILLLITAIFSAFTTGLYVGRSQRAEVTVSVPPALQTRPTEAILSTEPAQTQPVVVFPININTADKELLMELPGIGEVLAQRIIDYRSANGPFFNPEGLMNIEDIGEKRYESILDLITIGG